MPYTGPKKLTQQDFDRMFPYHPVGLKCIISAIPAALVGQLGLFSGVDAGVEVTIVDRIYPDAGETAAVWVEDVTGYRFISGLKELVPLTDGPRYYPAEKGEEKPPIEECHACALFCMQGTRRVCDLSNITLSETHEAPELRGRIHPSCWLPRQKNSGLIYGDLPVRV